MKVCNACNHKVPLDTIGICPRCEESKGYTIRVSVVDNITISDKITRVLTRIKITKMENKKAKKIALFLLAIFMIPVITIPNTEPFYYPIVILLALFSGVSPLFYPNHNTTIEKLIDRGS